jgi:hypothetical protein
VRQSVLLSSRPRPAASLQYPREQLKRTRRKSRVASCSGPSTLFLTQNITLPRGTAEPLQRYVGVWSRGEPVYATSKSNCLKPAYLKPELGYCPSIRRSAERRRCLRLASNCSIFLAESTACAYKKGFDLCPRLGPTLESNVASAPSPGRGEFAQTGWCVPRNIIYGERSISSRKLGCAEAVRADCRSLQNCRCHGGHCGFSTKRKTGVMSADAD